MDPRQSLSRTASSNISQSPYNNPNMSAYAGTMPPSYPGGTHLPPINPQYPAPPQLPPTNSSYMPQQSYRDSLGSRYTPNASPAQTPDRYGQQIAPHQPMNSMPSSQMLPQPHSQAPQSQTYTSQPGSRPSSYPQPLAPAPPRSSMDPYGNYGQPGDRAWSGAESMPGMTADVGRDPTRTHVVGSQGRRGILPSAPGRPPVMQNGMNGSPKGNPVPQKDADGKFPCPNCTKTYLHAKHLKRHMLRHTGDRPYMCVLCNDTFSRSDILKRHFQKCSVRRGNPTGASHLSNPAAHLKKSQAAAAKAAAAAASANASPNANTPSSSTAMQPSPYTTTSMPGSSLPATSTSLPAVSSMSYGMNANGQNEMQRSGGNQQMQGSGPQGGMDQNNPNWGMHNARGNQMMGGHQVGDDWNQMFPSGGNEGYMGQMYGYDQGHNDVKHESHEGGSNGYYMPSTTLGADGTLGSPLWNLNSTLETSLYNKVERLVDFCFPLGIQESLQEQQSNYHVRSCLTVDNVKHFIELYGNFQGHFPWLHLPTFGFLDAYDGLLLMIICAGAVYSDRISQTQVRSLILRVRAGIERTSQLLYHTSRTNPDMTFSPTETDLEELEALLIAQNLLTWHGGPAERSQARAEGKRLLQLVRQCRLLTLSPVGESSYSYLHNIKPDESIDVSRWNWHSWLQQEKRVRLMFMAFGTDGAFNLYFNCPPEFHPSEIKLPLPCDDAAWDAPDADRCAQALGLLGPLRQSHTNKSGSLRPRQLDMDQAYNSLFDATDAIQPRYTNFYGKFILIHALHTEIWQLQRQRSLASPNTSPKTATASSSSHINNMQRSITIALTRWKQCWDMDMQLQYPPNQDFNHPRRTGFCRDGIQFYWLARAFLQPNRLHDWRLPADTRFRQAMRGLKMAREWSLSDGAQRGEEPGSVADIDDTYETEVLELNMRKLFKPLGELQSGTYELDPLQLRPKVEGFMVQA